MGMFKAMKFEVRDSEHSKAIQEKLFSMGYKWLVSGTEIRNYGSSNISTDSIGRMINEKSRSIGEIGDELITLEELNSFKEENSMNELKLEGRKTLRVEGNKLAVGCQSYDENDVISIRNFLDENLRNGSFDKPEIKLATWYETSIGDRIIMKLDTNYMVFLRNGLNVLTTETLSEVERTYSFMREIK